MRQKTGYFLAVLVLICAFALAGCVASKYPLYKPQYYEPDYQLLGLWHSASDWHTHEYLHVVLDREKNMHLIRVAHPVSNRGKPVSIDELYIFPSRIGQLRFMNVELRGFDKKSKTRIRQYIVVKYTVSKQDELKVWVLKPQMIAQAIKKSEIAGERGEYNNSQYVRILARSKELRDWISSADENNYYPARVFKRLSKAAFREY